ncbi:MAG: RNA polymerase sigma factor [Candidatus Doudnabacteria bacterium]|nr:RNA polymerase sigma factor [Candidatus Doudnabacteria bacterium]
MTNSHVYNFASLKFDKNSQEIAQLAAKAKNGDSAAFGQIYDLFLQKIHKFIYYRVSHKQVAEDLAEEVFIKAYGKISALADTGVLEGWLYQIARNLVIDYYREKKLTVDLQDVENTLEYDTNIVDILNLQYQQAVLLKLVKELGPEQQAVIKMKFLEDLDTGEIAQILSITESNVRVIQHRALNRLIELRKKLEEEDE